MHRRVVLSFAILLGMVAVAQATPTIVVGNHGPYPQQASVTIDIFVTGMGTGANSITGLDLIVGIASQIPGPAPAGEPKINGVDVVTGTGFAGNNTTPAPGQVLFSSDQVWQVDDTTSGPDITADGKLFTIDINTLGVANNSVWSLAVFGVAGGGDSNYSNSTGTAFTFLGSNGTFSIVPEPSSVALGLFAVAGLGAVAIRRRRARG